MADYFTPTVIQPAIPVADITPLERLLLSHIFNAERRRRRLVFLRRGRPGRHDLARPRPVRGGARAIAGTADSTAASFVTEQLARVPADNVEIELDFSDMSWEAIFQDIVRRSATLRYVTAVSAFTCSKMRPDGFGGMAVADHRRRGDGQIDQRHRRGFPQRGRSRLGRTNLPKPTWAVTSAARARGNSRNGRTRTGKRERPTGFPRLPLSEIPYAENHPSSAARTATPPSLRASSPVGHRRTCGRSRRT